jgi:hypothetical protein
MNYVEKVNVEDTFTARVIATPGMVRMLTADERFGVS